MSEPTQHSIFPRTDWAELGRAAQADVPRLDALIRLYWQPLRIFLCATFPSLAGEADQLLQDFAEDKILKTGWLQKADQNRGRFRDFLKRSLRNFILDRLSRADVKHAPLSLDELEQELPEPAGAAEEFDLAWARTVLDETLRRMEADLRTPGKDQPRRAQIWELFQIRLIRPIFEDTPPPPYEELIARFGLRSPMDASNTLLSAKRIFKTQLARVIEEYAGRDAAAATEIRELENFLARLAQR